MNTNQKIYNAFNSFLNEEELEENIYIKSENTDSINTKESLNEIKKYELKQLTIYDEICKK